MTKPNPLETDLLGVTLQNPVIAASGTFGFGCEYAELMDVSRLGGISGKGLTIEACPGNTGTRVWETPSGLLNSIGLENPGIAYFVSHACHRMREFGPAVIANLGGHSEAEYVTGARLLNDADMDILELNISCPNIAGGGMAFGTDPQTAARITKAVKAVTRFPLLVKLSPSAGDLTGVAQAVEQAGADGISLVNTFLGMAVDVRAKRAVFDHVYAGLSGPAILPLALRMVHQVCKAVSVPVVGLGGIASAEDALMFLMAGATAVQVGAATFHNPNVMLEIIDGLAAYCRDEGLERLSQIRGIVSR